MIPISVRWLIVAKALLFCIGVSLSVYLLEERQEQYTRDRRRILREAIISNFHSVLNDEKEIVTAMLVYERLSYAEMNITQVLNYRSLVTSNDYRSYLTYTRLNYSQLMMERDLLYDTLGYNISIIPPFDGYRWFFTELSPVEKLKDFLLRDLTNTVRMGFINEVLEYGEATLLYTGFTNRPLLTLGTRIDENTLNAIVFPLADILDYVNLQSDVVSSFDCEKRDKDFTTTFTVFGYPIDICFEYGDEHHNVTDVVIASGSLIVLLFVLVWLLIRRLHRQADERMSAYQKSMREFMMFVSHEIRNPLFQLQNLKRFDEVPYVAQKMALVLDNLQGVMEQDNLALLSVQVFGSDKLFETINEIYAVRSKELNLELSEDCTCEIQANFDRLVLTVTNMIDNAIKYSGNNPIRYSQYVANEHLRLEVVDQGVGISESHISRVFECGFRVGGTSAHGTGLGLYLAKKHTEAMGGQIEVRSEKGVGSTFTVLFPIHNDKSAYPSTSSELALPTIELAVEIDTAATNTNAFRNTVKVLAIDDEPFILEVLKRQLSGYDVSVATDIASVTDLSAYSVFIVDYFMPKQLGTEVIKTIRRHNCTGAIIGLSGNGLDAETHSALLESGANSVLTKPCRREQLLLEVERLAREQMSRSA